MNPVRNEAANVFTSRREWAIALALIGCGVGVRLWVASRSAVEHFDEGVYASNLYFGEPDFAYPMQHLYAPPLLPSLIEAEMIAGLPPNFAAILPSLVAGCATLVAVWRIGRRWFGPAAGVASLALGALSDFHIAYSSTALTDVLLTLLVLLAVGAIAKAVASAISEPEGIVAPPRIERSEGSGRRKRVDRSRSQQADCDGQTLDSPLQISLASKWAVIAGLLTAAAWWTKYSGWLPLAIGGAGIGLLLVIASSARSGRGRLLLVFLLIGGTAAVAWSPVPLGLDGVGGYSAVAENHAKYVVGPSGWIASACRQIARQSAMEGVLSWLSVLAALACARPLIQRNSSDGGFGIHPIGLLAPGLLLLTAVVESTFVVLLVLSAAALAAKAAAWVQLRDQRKLDEGTAGLCLVLAWFCGLIVATPTYYPYPRLAMPLMACMWLAAGSGLAMLARADKERPQAIERNRSLRFGWIIAAGLLAALPLAYVARAPIQGAGGSLGIDRTGTRRAAREIAAKVDRSSRSAEADLSYFIYVHGEPALLFQLHAAGLPYLAPVSSPPKEPVRLADRSLPTYYVYGPHAEDDERFMDQWSELKADFELVSPGGIELHPSSIVRMDTSDPRKSSIRSDRVWLYRRKETVQAGGPE